MLDHVYTYWDSIKLYFIKFGEVHFALIRPSKFQGHIFSFAEFASALAIFVILYSMTDIRYRFRISIAPFYLNKLSYCFLLIIGFGLLLTNYWFAEGWPIWAIISDSFSWQFVFGFMFFMLVLLWVSYAFIIPPVFKKKNSKNSKNIKETW